MQMIHMNQPDFSLLQALAQVAPPQDWVARTDHKLRSRMRHVMPPTPSPNYSATT
jgi:hypothetical protein